MTSGSSASRAHSDSPFIVGLARSPQSLFHQAWNRHFCFGTRSRRGRPSCALAAKLGATPLGRLAPIRVRATLLSMAEYLDDEDLKIYAEGLRSRRPAVAATSTSWNS